MLVLNKRQDTNAEKNVVFIVFYSLYFVYYYILKYLLFTIVAPFGKDIFFSQRRGGNMKRVLGTCKF